MARNGTFPPAPSGDVRVIGPNGTTRSEGEQSPFSNGLQGRGDLGTASTGDRLVRGGTNTNRTGERY